VRSSGAAVYANFFMGSATDTVEYRIGDGPWSMMQRVSEWDPAYARAVQDWDYWEDLPAGRRPSNPVICSHLWKGRLTSNLPAGEYRIEVRAKDRFQRIHSAAGFYKVK
jgi:hypothetical protein